MTDSIPSTMKAWVFDSTAGGVEKNLQLRDDVFLPPSARALKTDELLVKTSAVSLNPVDYKLPEIPIMGRLVVKRPASPGLDFSGTVVALGPQSGKHKHHLEVGQLVIGRLDGPGQHGTLAEYVVSTRNGTVAAPKGLSAEDAAGIGTAGLSAYQSLQPYVKTGDNVFINGGSGGVGLLSIQIAKILGCHVTVSCSGANVELCKSVGADEVIDYRAANVIEQLKNNTSKYDLIIDNAGTKTLFWAGDQFAKAGAPHIQVAGTPGLADILDGLQRFLVPRFLGGPSTKLSYFFVWNKPEDLSQLGQWIAEGNMRMIKDEVFAWKDAPRAYERLRTGRARGKIVITADHE